MTKINYKKFISVYKNIIKPKKQANLSRGGVF